MIAVVPVDPPREGLVPSSLVDETPLSAADAVALYEAAVTDVLRAVADSGADLLVNYRDAETLPDASAAGDAEADVRTLSCDGLGLESVPDDGTLRLERQVGSSRSARLGNTVTHLLEREGADSVAVLEPTAPLVRRTVLDGVAMSLRRNDVVLAPATNGAVALAGFAEPIDFTDAYTAPAVATLARRARDADLAVGFTDHLPTLESPAGLRTIAATLAARRAVGTPGGEATRTVLEELGLGVGADGDLERRDR